MKMGLLMVALLCISMALAENVTVSSSRQLSVQCSEFNCIFYTEGMTPLLMSVMNQTFNVTVPYTYTYEKIPVINYTNMSVVCTNLPTLNVTTQTYNLTVETCDLANFTPKIDTAAVAENLKEVVAESVAGKCQEACALADAEKQSLINDANDLRMKYANQETVFNSRLNETTIKYEADLNLSRADVERADSQTMEWMLLTFLFGLAMALMGAVMYRQSRPPKMASGTIAAPVIRRGE